MEREGGRRGKFCLPRAEEKEEEEESSSYGTMKVTLPGISVVLAARFATIGDVWLFFSFSVYSVLHSLSRWFRAG